MVMALCGNSIVMFIQWKKLKSSQNFRIFIPFLALSDCVASVVCSSFTVYENYNWYTFKDRRSCKFAWFSVTFAQTTCVIFLFLIAIQRYIRICHPFYAVFKQKLKIGVVISAIIFLCFQTVPLIFFSDVIQHDNIFPNFTVYECRMLENHSTINTTYRYIDDGLMLGVICAVVVLYTKSGITLWKLAQQALNQSSKYCYNANNVSDKPSPACLDMTQTSDELSSSIGVLDSDLPKTSKSTTRKKSKTISESKYRKYRNINIMFIIITVITVLGYIPRTIFNVIELHVDSFWFRLPEKQLRTLLVLKRLYLGTFFYNPIIYSIMDIEFRKEVKKLFCSRCYL